MNPVPIAPPTATPRLAPTEHTVVLRDGTALFYRAWIPPGATEKALLLFHRGHEHSGRWQETVEALGLEESFVLVANHASHLDTLCLLAALPLAKLHRAFPAAAKK